MIMLKGSERHIRSLERDRVLWELQHELKHLRDMRTQWNWVISELIRGWEHRLGQLLEAGAETDTEETEGMKTDEEDETNQVGETSPSKQKKNAH